MKKKNEMTVLSQFKNDLPFKLVSSNLHVLQICESYRKFGDFTRELADTRRRVVTYIATAGIINF